MPKLACALLVDDDDTANYLHELLFKRMDASEKLLVARNGLEALKLLSENCPGPNCPSLILLDINMPIMDGFEFLDAFAAWEYDQKQSIVLIMLSTSLNPRDIAKVQRASVSGFVNKPLTSKSLQALLNQHFGQ